MGNSAGIFQHIYNEMRFIRYRLEDIEKALYDIKTMKATNVDRSPLLSLPDHLRRTFEVVLEYGECDATCVSKQTKKCRAVESSHLNELVRMNRLVKYKKSKGTYFSLSIGGPNGNLR